MTEVRTVELPARHQPLRADVSLLGNLVGQMLVEQHGDALLQRVEQVRKAAIADRQDSDPGSQRLEGVLASLDADETARVIKAFSSYMRSVNLAEKVHRIRRRRAYQRAGGAPQRGSLDAVLGELQAAGISQSQLLGELTNLAVQPVFTAHPTEATRRTILEKEYEIVLRLVDRLNPELTPQEEEIIRQRILAALSSAWQTRLVPHARPTVADELDNILFYVTDILYRVVPVFYENLQSALMQHYPLDAQAWNPPDILRFGSWVGGDMDGNPNVHAGTIDETLRTQRRAIIGRYIGEVEQLRRSLSQSSGHAGFDPAVLARLDEYEQSFPDVAQGLVDRHRDMPYRCLLQFVKQRLQDNLSDGDKAYPSVSGLLEDLQLIAGSLLHNQGRHAGWFGLRRLVLRVRAFGFHLLTLDVRQDALLHRQVMAEWLEDPQWLERSVAERTDELSRRLQADDWPELPAAGQASHDLTRSIEVFAILADARRRYGDNATGLFIISMTQGADDVLTVMALARAGGLADHQNLPLDIAPLLETVDDLQAGPQILDTLLQLPVYHHHLQQRRGRQVVMIGYSDSNKDSGIVAARWALQQAQFLLTQQGRRHGCEVVFFHGRGGTVSRGGGNLVNGILGAPAGSVSGCLRLTEQGEVINRKYGVRPIALRNLELMTGACLEHSLLNAWHGDSGAPPDAESVVELMARVSREAYRGLVHENPDFPAFFRSFTPVDVIERLNIGSRPASRRSGQGIGNLRAIPWVFSWAQTRVGLPGIYGFGTAFEEAVREFGLPALQRLLADWPFFRALIDDVEMVLAKNEMNIGRRYAQLVDDSHRPIYREIEEEFSRAEQGVLQIRQARRLLDDNPTLQRNIWLRNPYVDPLHMLQIDLLQRWRERERPDDELLQALMGTVNGIALGIQNTG